MHSLPISSLQCFVLLTTHPPLSQAPSSLSLRWPLHPESRESCIHLFSPAACTQNFQHTIKPEPTRTAATPLRVSLFSHLAPRQYSLDCIIPKIPTNPLAPLPSGPIEVSSIFQPVLSTVDLASALMRTLLSRSYIN